MSPGQPPGSPDQPAPGEGVPTCLYLLQANANGLYRIGVATDWPAQAPGLGVGVTTRLIGVAPVNAPTGLLRFLRHRFAAQRLAQSDWYRLDAEAVTFLEVLLAKAQDDFQRGHPQLPLAPWSRVPLGEPFGEPSAVSPGANGAGQDPGAVGRPPWSRGPSPRSAGFRGSRSAGPSPGLFRPRRTPGPGRRGRGDGPMAEVVELLLLTPLALMLAGLAFLVPPALMGGLSLGAASLSEVCSVRQEPGSGERPAECRSRAFWLGFWASLPPWGLALLLWLLRSRPDPDA